ncbi:MAG: UDP-N-acetylmuramate--L-alanine ligase [Bacteroidia bacterium]
MNKVYTYYYLIGVGGIGMSALARFFNAMGKKVYGYDKTPSPLINELMAEGVEIQFEDEVEKIPIEIRENKEQSLIVYTPAIPNENIIFQYFTLGQFDLFKRSKVLGMVTDDSLNISVAGTHGKTTTSSMVAAIFMRSNKRFTAFLGGISADLGSNFYHQEGEGAHYSITEADEYDRSFLELNPTWAVITSTDSDHLDIYGTAQEIQATFSQFASKLDKDNLLQSMQSELDIKSANYAASNVLGDYHATAIRWEQNGTYFSIVEGDHILMKDLYLNIPGIHNLENAVAAAVICSKADISEEIIKKGLAEFKGIKRRFEFIVKEEDLVFIDDYAHHPSELDSIISSVRELFPHKKIVGIFQPHLYSRTNDFAADFAQSLQALDELYLLPIYPAREKPIEGVSSKFLFELIDMPNKHLVEKDQLFNQLEFDKIDVLLTLGAGDIDRLVQPLKEKYHG